MIPADFEARYWSRFILLAEVLRVGGLMVAGFALGGVDAAPVPYICELLRL